jgi:Domain of unknown function (DUF1963)
MTGHNRRHVVQSMLALTGGATLPASAQAPRKAAKKTTGAKRTFPMFTDEADARAVIKTYCNDDADTPIGTSDADLIVSRLKPQFWIEPAPSHAAPKFRTHFGGAPELPKGAAWPMRRVPADAQSVADGLNRYKNQKWIAAHILRELPFEFIAQIDLAEAARYPATADGLPKTGRLLLFWDGVVGLHIGGAPACKVIWDQAPAVDLEPVPFPAVFSELETSFAAGQLIDFKDTAQDLLKALPDTLEIMRSAGLTEKDIRDAEKAVRDQLDRTPVLDPNAKKPYVYPRRAMRLTPILHLPHERSAEVELDAELSRLLKNESVAECYRILTSRDEGPFTKEGSGVRRQRFLGTPDPEQDDPLYEAIDTSKYPEGPWSEATIQDASRQASAWRLLLQIDLAGLAQVLGEGTVYFIIRKDDLARRDFSQVHAYYQQT